MRLKTPVQPLVFRFMDATSLCGAVTDLYEQCPYTPASLALYHGVYYLAVRCSLGKRSTARKAAATYGKPLGACGVLYAYYEEHGRSLSQDAIAELGGALHRSRE